MNDLAHLWPLTDLKDLVTGILKMQLQRVKTAALLHYQTSKSGDELISSKEYDRMKQGLNDFITSLVRALCLCPRPLRAVWNQNHVLLASAVQHNLFVNLLPVEHRCLRQAEPCLHKANLLALSNQH